MFYGVALVAAVRPAHTTPFASQDEWFGWFLAKCTVVVVSLALALWLGSSAKKAGNHTGGPETAGQKIRRAALSGAVVAVAFFAFIAQVIATFPGAPPRTLPANFDFDCGASGRTASAPDDKESFSDFLRSQQAGQK